MHFGGRVRVAAGTRSRAGQIFNCTCSRGRRARARGRGVACAGAVRVLGGKPSGVVSKFLTSRSEPNTRVTTHRQGHAQLVRHAYVCYLSICR